MHNEIPATENLISNKIKIKYHLNHKPRSNTKHINTFTSTSVERITPHTQATAHITRKQSNTKHAGISYYS